MRARPILLATVLALFAVLIAACGGGDGTAGPTVEVEMGEFFFEPETIEVEEGTELVVRAVNTGEQTHDLKLEGGDGTDFLLAGDSETVNLGEIEEDTEIVCTVPGHLESGMRADVVVVPAAPSASR